MLIRTHPQEGYNILKDVKFPWPIAEIILQHHERTDGSGYPQGLKGEKILLEAKIMCVADVVEAMSSHRPYRPSLGVNPALDEIRRGCKTLYDESVVGACLALFEEDGFKFSTIAM
jgi:HD-GYP domain-containing protein (c-di-GMP phosphodiesterase class II)